MAQGYERREGVQDPNAQRARATGQADTVPLAPVMKPNPSSFSGVGDSALADVLGNAAQLFGKYQEKKDEETKLDAQLGYAQGVTEDEAKKKGTVYHQEWLGVKAVEAGEVLYQTAMADIPAKYAGIPTEQYREVLMAQFREMSNKVGDDPFMRKLLSAQVHDKFPKLVAEQNKQFNAFNKQENEASTVGALVTMGSSVDPAKPEDTLTNIREFAEHAGTSMTPQDRASVKMRAAIQALKDGNPVVKEALFGAGAPSAVVGQLAAPTNTALAQAILTVESGNKHTTPDGKLTQGREVTRKDGKKAVALGRWQIMSDLLKDYGYGVEPAKNNTPEEIDRYGERVFTAVSSRYNNDPLWTALAYNGGIPQLESAFAAIGDPRKGEISTAEFLRKFPNAEAKEYAAKIQAQLGVTPPTMAVKMDSGALLQAGYTEDQVNALRAATHEYEKDHQDKAEIFNAISSNTMNTLSGDKLTKGLDMVKSDIAHKLSLQGLSGKEFNERGISQYYDVLIKNDVVDTRLQQTIDRVLDPANAIGKDGKISTEASETLHELAMLRNKSTPQYFSKYISKDNEGFVLRAMTYIDDGGDPKEALRKSARIQTQIDDGSLTIKPMDDKVFEKVYNENTENLLYSFWDALVPNFMQNKPHLDVAEQPIDYTLSSDDISNGMSSVNGELFKNQVSTLAQQYYPDIQDVKGATSKAMGEILQRTQFPFGKPIVAPRGATWEKAMGLPANVLDKYTGAVNFALADYIKDAADYSVVAGLVADINDLATRAANVATPAIGAIVGADKETIDMTREQATADAKAKSDKLGVFGKKYRTFWGEGNDLKTASRGVPSYDHIVITPDFDGGYLRVNLKDPETGLVSPMDFRVNLKLLGEKVQERIIKEERPWYRFGK